MQFEEVFSVFLNKHKAVKDCSNIKQNQIDSLCKALKDIGKCRFEREHIQEFVKGVGKFYVLLIEYYRDITECDKLLPVMRGNFSIPLHVAECLNISNNKLFIKKLIAVIDNIVQIYSSAYSLKEMLRVYNVLLMKSNRELCKKYSTKHSSLKTLYEIVKVSNDIEAQAVIIEVFLRLFSDSGDRQRLTTFFPEMSYMQSINLNNLYPNIRMVIDMINIGSDEILSVNCKVISINSVAVVDQQDMQANDDVWLDFNVDERKMSFFCDKNFLSSVAYVSYDSATTWEIVAFNVDDVRLAQFTKSGSYLDIRLTLKSSNIFILSNSNKPFDSNITFNISISKRAQKFCAVLEVLKMLFPNAFDYDDMSLSFSTVSDVEVTPMTDDDSRHSSPIITHFKGQRTSRRLSTMVNSVHTSFQFSSSADQNRVSRFSNNFTSDSEFVTDKSSEPSIVFGAGSIILISDDENDETEDNNYQILMGEQLLCQAQGDDENQNIKDPNARRRLSQNVASYKHMNKSITPVSFTDSVVGRRRRKSYFKMSGVTDENSEGKVSNPVSLTNLVNERRRGSNSTMSGVIDESFERKNLNPVEALTDPVNRRSRGSNSKMSRVIDGGFKGKVLKPVPLKEPVNERSRGSNSKVSIILDENADGKVSNSTKISSCREKGVKSTVASPMNLSHIYEQDEVQRQKKSPDGEEEVPQDSNSKVCAWLEKHLQNSDASRATELHEDNQLVNLEAGRECISDIDSDIVIVENSSSKIIQLDVDTTINTNTANGDREEIVAENRSAITSDNYQTPKNNQVNEHCSNGNVVNESILANLLGGSPKQKIINSKVTNDKPICSTKSDGGFEESELQHKQNLNSKSVVKLVNNVNADNVSDTTVNDGSVKESELQENQNSNIKSVELENNVKVNNMNNIYDGKVKGLELQQQRQKSNKSSLVELKTKKELNKLNKLSMIIEESIDTSNEECTPTQQSSKLDDKEKSDSSLMSIAEYVKLFPRREQKRYDFDNSSCDDGTKPKKKVNKRKNNSCKAPDNEEMKKGPAGHKINFKKTHKKRELKKQSDNKENENVSPFLKTRSKMTFRRIRRPISSDSDEEQRDEDLKPKVPVVLLQREQIDPVMFNVDYKLQTRNLTPKTSPGRNEIQNKEDFDNISTGSVHSNYIRKETIDQNRSLTVSQRQISLVERDQINKEISGDNDCNIRLKNSYNTEDSGDGIVTGALLINSSKGTSQELNKADGDNQAMCQAETESEYFDFVTTKGPENFEKHLNYVQENTIQNVSSVDDDLSDDNGDCIVTGALLEVDSSKGIPQEWNNADRYNQGLSEMFQTETESEYIDFVTTKGPENFGKNLNHVRENTRENISSVDDDLSDACISIQANSLNNNETFESKLRSSNEDDSKKYAKIHEEMASLHNVISLKETQEVATGASTNFCTPDIIKMLEEKDKTENDTEEIKSSTPKKLFNADDILAPLDNNTVNNGTAELEISISPIINKLKDEVSSKPTFVLNKNDTLCKTQRRKKTLYDPSDLSYLAEPAPEIINIPEGRIKSEKTLHKTPKRKPAIRRFQKKDRFKEISEKSDWIDQTTYKQNMSTTKFDKMFDSLKNSARQSKEEKRHSRKRTRAEANQSSSSPSSVEPFFVETNVKPGKADFSELDEIRPGKKTKVHDENLQDKYSNNDKIKIISNVVLKGPHAESGNKRRCSKTSCQDCVTFFREFVEFLSHIQHGNSSRLEHSEIFTKILDSLDML